MAYGPRFGSMMQVLAIGVVLVGVVIAGFSAYSGYQSSPYMVQAQQVDTSPSASATAYEDLSSSKQAVFDRLVGTDGVKQRAVPVGGGDLTFFANTVVQYNGAYYVFVLTYDPGSPILLIVATGLGLAGLGTGLLLLNRCRERRSPGQRSTSA